MTMPSTMKRLIQGSLVATLFVWLGSVKAGEPDPKIMSYKLPDKIPWTARPGGNEVYIISGDPSKPGMYVELLKWTPHHFSRPHYHPNDRFVVVVKGTWWVGWGPKYDESTTYPLKPGSTATHFAKQIHWDGAKDEEAIIEIVGMGPETSVNAEQK